MSMTSTSTKVPVIAPPLAAAGKSGAIEIGNGSEAASTAGSSSSTDGGSNVALYALFALIAVVPLVAAALALGLHKKLSRSSVLDQPFTLDPIGSEQRTICVTPQVSHVDALAANLNDEAHMP